MSKLPQFDDGNPQTVGLESATDVIILDDDHKPTPNVQTSSLPMATGNFQMALAY